MGLNFGSIFPEQRPDINDDGYMSVIDNLTRADVNAEGYMSVIDNVTRADVDANGYMSVIDNLTRADVSADGYMSVIGSYNLAEDAKITGGSGSFLNMFDYNTTTSYGNGGQGLTIYYVTFDFHSIKENMQITIYYNLWLSGSGNNGTVTLQTSENGTNWTDIDSVNGSTGAGAPSTYFYASHSEKVTLRYFRLKIEPKVSNKTATGNINTLKIGKVW